MKLLLLNYEYAPVGGETGAHTKYMAELLAASGNDITVITTAFGDNEISSIENGVRIIRINAKRKNIRESNIWEKISWMQNTKSFLKKHLKNEKYDLCVAEFALPCGEVSYSMNLMYKLPYVVISHGYDIPWFNPNQMMWYHAICYQWLRKICMQAECNYAPTNELKKNLNAFIGINENKTRTIRCGYDSRLFFKEQNAESKDFTILYDGKFTTEKDPMTLLKAINIIKNDIPDFKSRIIGYGNLQSSMQKYIAENKLSANVEIINEADAEKIAEEYKSASLIVIPSLEEASNSSMIKACACGLYTIATKTDEAENYVSEKYNGDFFEKGDFNALARLILNFYEEKFKTGYSFDVFSEIENLEIHKIVKLYEEDFAAIIDHCRIRGKIQR